MKLFEFQQKLVDALSDKCTEPGGKDTIVVKAPTGAGKTIVLVHLIERLADRLPNAAFVWLCPGQGELEEQSMLRMKQVNPQRETMRLFEALSKGFAAGSTTFINWELVTNKKNVAVREAETKNLFDKIQEAQQQGVEFILIIDEEHSHNTAKANKIREQFAPKRTIRVSATAKKDNRYDYIEVDEAEVIDSGLITRALYVNEGVRDGDAVSDEISYLLTLGDKKRKAIARRYKEKGKNINPLVLIQFPNAQPETVKAVEQQLETMGYTTANGMVSKWMSEEKVNLPDNFSENHAVPVFLLMKQAISTGWDCPRAKILIKLRENMSEGFEIQTIGRIRRMPEACHYDDDLLDFCYVYTFDEKYKAGLLDSMDRAYETRCLSLRHDIGSIELKKQTRDLDFDGMDQRQVLQKIHDFYTDQVTLGGDFMRNVALLKEKGYVFGTSLKSEVLTGDFIHIEALSSSTSFISVNREFDFRVHSLLLTHCLDEMKSTLGMSHQAVHTILQRLFKKGANCKQKLLSLAPNEFASFVINNRELLKGVCRTIASEMVAQSQLVLAPKEIRFEIPKQDFLHYDSTVKSEKFLQKNVYKGYTTGFCTGRLRSTCEILFEQYCEKNDDIEWVYKNGDRGMQYFSVVYLNGVNRQFLFYADYIVKTKNGEIWIIETKGGEIAGKDKNIDSLVKNKFAAFKEYARLHHVKWGFVRDLDLGLYFNNTEYADSMQTEHWIPLEEVL